MRNTQRNRAVKCWWMQVYRCTNPKDKMYKYYGGRGIKVEYSKEEFIDWWMKQPLELRIQKRIAVGRIDHSKNYSLDNIELSSASDNTNEMLKRTGGNSVGTPIVMVGDDGVTHAFCSMGKAAKHFGMCPAAILGRIRRGANVKPKPWRRSFHGTIYHLDDFMEL